MTDTLLPLLKKHFGYDSFRPLQEEIISHLLAQKDALVLMPTGGGKSICFQLPALALPGITLVISPLIALMKDQVEGLIENGIPAAALNSLNSEEQRRSIRQRAFRGELKLLYISPEGLFAEIDYLLKDLQVSLIAIDEAHCISRWGHDFRPEYTKLAILKERFPGVPVVALTATADRITKNDIVDQLQLSEYRVFQSSFDRPNLSLSVLRGMGKREKIAAIVRFMQERPGQSGIIYCMKRVDTEGVAATLETHGFRTAAYHAGLPGPQREKAQDDFINDRIDVVCATIAFGMGIDKSNVRWVIHYNMPGSIENYYQEIGRAGRDGLPSDTLLFYSLGDLVLLKHFADESGQDDINREKLNRMQRYCETDLCRRRILLNYFNEESDCDCGNCDVCLNPPDRFDGTVLVQKALSAVLRTEERVGVQMLIDILRGSGRMELLERGYDRLKTYGAGGELPYRVWREYIYQMIQLGYLEIDYADSQTLKVTASGRKVLFGEAVALLTRFREQDEIIRPLANERRERVRKEPKEKKETRRREPSEKKKQAKKVSVAPGDMSAEDALMESLRELRKGLAGSKPAYIVFSDAALLDMAWRRPVTLVEFADVKGVGEAKLEKYGEIFTDHIRDWIKNNG